MEPDLCPVPCLLDPIPTLVVSHPSQKPVTVASALEEARSQLPRPLRSVHCLRGRMYLPRWIPGIYEGRVARLLSVTPGLSLCSLVVLSPDPIPLVETPLLASVLSVPTPMVPRTPASPTSQPPAFLLDGCPSTSNHPSLQAESLHSNIPEDSQPVCFYMTSASLTGSGRQQA